MHPKTGLRRIASLLSMIFFALVFASTAAAQQKERTLDEIKTEAIKRAENGMYPLIGLDPSDLREAFASIKTTDKDEWAAAFIAVADRYMAEATSLEKSDPAKANADYIRAWRVYSFGRWPVPASPGKQRAYAKAIEAFRAHARFWDPPLEIVHIPFEGSEIVGYLRLPKSAQGPVPLVLAISGLDSRKEDLSENFSAILPYGIGFFAVDGPGTGQAPIKVSPTADRMFSRVLDYLQTRAEVDKTKIAVHGVSWGAYWGTKLAIVERPRLKAVSAQSPPAHLFFQKEYMLNTMFGNREYLFDHAPAFMSIIEGVNSLEDMVARFPKLSLVEQQLLGKPTAPMLIIGGVLDTQVPISDLYLILNSGDVPKEAWINPQGGHLGRQVKVWPDPVIFRQVIIPWLVRKLDVDAGGKEAKM
jgi:cephalosporin-C deacetylase-like acetyl esterase